MANMAAKALVAAAIIGGSLFATNGAAFAAENLPTGADVVGTAQDSVSDQIALTLAYQNAAAQCQSGFTKGAATSNVYTIAGGTVWAAWVRTTCA